MPPIFWVGKAFPTKGFPEEKGFPVRLGSERCSGGQREIDLCPNKKGVGGMGENVG